MRYASLICLLAIVASSAYAQIPRDSLALWFRADRDVLDDTPFCSGDPTSESGDTVGC